MTEYRLDKNYAIESDNKDPLKHFKDKFYIPQYNGKNATYFLGNSLGAQPKSVQNYLSHELQKWQDSGALAHFDSKEPWIHYHETVANQMAKIVGAKASEIIAMNSLTINLHLMMVSFYQPTKSRFKILVNSHLFPSDRFAIETQLKFHHLDPDSAMVPFPLNQQGNLCYDSLEKLFQENGDQFALVLIEGVNYFTGEAVDINRITKLAHKYGCKAGFDLAHAAGNQLLNLHSDDVDFAIWCTYKYLNGGPGSVGCSFVHEKHHNNEQLPRLAGWFGHKQPRFNTDEHFHPIPNAEGWQVSNPPVLSLAALRASLDIFEEAQMKKLREKSIKLTGYLEFLLNALNQQSFRIITPSQPDQRGCQLSLDFGEKNKYVLDELKKQGYICDLRPPNALRIAPVPLYNTYLDVFHLYTQLQKILA